MEICYNKMWGSVCHNSWNIYDANVVCKQLGYQSTGRYLYKNFCYLTIVLKVLEYYGIVILDMGRHHIYFLMLDVPHMEFITLSYNVLTMLYMLLSIVEIVQ